jgi:hypothetical protein
MDLHEDIIKKYWRTLERKNISNISNNKFIKKPYLENYIIKLSLIEGEDIIDNEIIRLINVDKITNEEIYLYLINTIEFNLDDKKKINTLLDNNEIPNNTLIKIIKYQIKYFQYYQTITELLFDSNEENDLYNFILIYIKNNKKDINYFLKKNIKFNIFYEYTDQLFQLYKEMIFLINDKNNDNKIILNLFLKNIFTNWYNIYKRDILENRVNEKTCKYVRKGILSKILCTSNI